MSEYKVTNSDTATFELDERGGLWWKLAFYESHPKLSESVRKVAEYKYDKTRPQMLGMYPIMIV